MEAIYKVVAAIFKVLAALAPVIALIWWLHQALVHLLRNSRVGDEEGMAPSDAAQDSPQRVLLSRGGSARLYFDGEYVGISSFVSGRWSTETRCRLEELSAVRPFLGDQEAPQARMAYSFLTALMGGSTTVGD